MTYTLAGDSQIRSETFYLLLVSLAVCDVLTDALISTNSVHGLEDGYLLFPILWEVEKVVPLLQQFLHHLQRNSMTSV